MSGHLCDLPEYPSVIDGTRHCSICDTWWKPVEITDRLVLAFYGLDRGHLVWQEVVPELEDE